jgi:hypothetical protein
MLPVVFRRRSFKPYWAVLYQSEIRPLGRILFFEPNETAGAHA